MNNKLLCVGDLHTKQHILDAIQPRFAEYERVVFLGDYCDDWVAMPEDSYYLLKSLVELKQQQPERIILLLGNHDLSEWLGSRFSCSGFNYNTHALVKPFFDEHQDLFQLAFCWHKIVFTHAGITTGWLRSLPHIKLKEIRQTLKDNPAWLTELFNESLTKTDDPVAQTIFNAFAQAGPARGGSGAPSPIWADKKELLADPAPFLAQIVGHTPVPNIEVTPQSKAHRLLAFCDTFSHHNFFKKDYIDLLQVTGAGILETIRV